MIDALPTTSPRRLNARGLQSRERMLEAAVRLLWRDGYNGVSVNDICVAAGAQKGSFYHAFPSKDALVVEAIHDIWNANRAEIQEIYASSLPLRDRLRRHMEWFGQSQRRLKARYGFVPGTFNMALNIGAPASVLEVNRQATEEHGAMLLNAIADLLGAAGHSEDAVYWLTDVARRLIAGAHIEARIGNTLEPFETLPETVLALLGLGSPPNRASWRTAETD